MNMATTIEPEPVVEESIWLELCVDGIAHTFELKADEKRAIAVGSSSRADLRIARTGVAPVQFHIERERRALWIVPGYNSCDLRVDAASITGTRRIDGCAVIEFSRVRVHARLLDADVLMRRDSPMGKLSKRGAEQATVRISPIFEQVVIPVRRTVVIDPFRVVPRASAQVCETTLPALVTGEDQAQLRLATIRVKALSDVPTRDTIKMKPFWMNPADLEAPIRHNSVASEIMAFQRQTAPNDGNSLAVPKQPEHVDREAADAAVATTLYEPAWNSSAPPPLALDAGTQSTTVFDVPHIRPREPAARGWLTRLGLLGKRRPLFVWLAGTVLAFALSASVALLAKHYHHASKPFVSHPNSPKPSVPNSAAPSTSASPNPTLASTSAPEPIAVIAAVPSIATGTAKKGQPTDPALAAAAGHILAGRYSEAHSAYAALAVRSPNDPSLAVLVRLLSRKMEPGCSRGAPDSKTSCPEVNP